MPGQKASQDARRARILRAAYDVASRRGLHALTGRLVATRAGLSNGLVLFHFKTKGQLLAERLDYVLETTTVLHITDDIDEYLPAAQGLIGQLVSTTA